MTIEQFFTIPQGSYVYNKNLNTIGCTGSAYSYLTTRISELVAEVIATGKTNDTHYISLQWTFNERGHVNHISNFGLLARDEWDVVQSFSELDNQFLINKALMYEIQQLKMALRSQFITFPPLLINGISVPLAMANVISPQSPIELY